MFILILYLTAFVKPSLYFKNTSFAKQAEISVIESVWLSVSVVVVNPFTGGTTGGFGVFLKYLANKSLVSLTTSFGLLVFSCAKISFLAVLLFNLFKIEAVLRPTGDEKKLPGVLLLLGFVFLSFD